jgi:hypothetical protein
MFIWLKNANMKQVLKSSVLIILMLSKFVRLQEEDAPRVEILNSDIDLDENLPDSIDTSFSKSLNPKKNQLVPPYVHHESEYKRVCIYPNWSILRDSNVAKIFPEDIPADLCTHIHYAYANIDVRTLQLAPSQFQDTNSGDHGGVS